jgi:hypothetical protein
MEGTMEHEQLHPIEEKVNDFFESMMDEVDSGEKAGVLMESLTNAILAFVTLKFKGEGKQIIIQTFCRDLKHGIGFSQELIEILKQEEANSNRRQFR